MRAWSALLAAGSAAAALMIAAGPSAADRYRDPAPERALDVAELPFRVPAGF